MRIFIEEDSFNVESGSYDNKWFTQTLSEEEVDRYRSDDVSGCYDSRALYADVKVSEQSTLYTKKDGDEYSFQLDNQQTIEKNTYLGYDNLLVDIESQVTENVINVLIDDEREEAFLADLAKAGFYEPSIDINTTSEEDIGKFFGIVQSYEKLPEQIQQRLSQAVGVDIEESDITPPKSLQEMCKDVISDDVNLFVDAMDDVRFDREDKADITKKYTQKVLDRTLKNNQIER